jgi:hypothetical protein
MSAFGGKADIEIFRAQCLLLSAFDPNLRGAPKASKRSLAQALTTYLNSTVQIGTR